MAYCTDDLGVSVAWCDECGAERWPEGDSHHAEPIRTIWTPFTDDRPCSVCGRRADLKGSADDRAFGA